ncbi:MAG: hypothetical protein Q9210_001128 [Variospora velana]
MASSIYALRVNPVALLALALLISVPTVMLFSTPSPFWERIDDSIDTAADRFHASVISSYSAIRSCLLGNAYSYGSVIIHMRERIVQVSKSTYFIISQISATLYRLALLLSHLAIGTIATLLFLRSVVSCLVAIFFVIDAAWSEPRQSWQRKCSFIITAILFGIFLYGLISAVVPAVHVIMHAYDAFSCAGSVVCRAIYSVCCVPSNIYLAALDMFTFWAEAWTRVSGFAGLVFRYSYVVFVHLAWGINILLSMICTVGAAAAVGSAR